MLLTRLWENGKRESGRRKSRSRSLIHGASLFARPSAFMIGRMSLIADILGHNTSFVEKKEYEPFRTDRFPDKKLAVLTCMDTRLVELLPRAMNLRNGDIKLLKNAGALVSHPFGSMMRSILVAGDPRRAPAGPVGRRHRWGVSGGGIG